MLDNHLHITQTSSVTHINEVPEKIEVNLVKENKESFLLEFHNTSQGYKNLFGENPFITEKIWHTISPGECCLNQIDKALGGYWIDNKIFVNVLRLLYIGNNKFIFELTRK